MHYSTDTLREWMYICMCIYTIIIIIIIKTKIIRWSLKSDYDCILAMLLRKSRNGKLEVTRFSAPTTSKTVSLIRRNASAARPGWQHQAVLTITQYVKGRGGFWPHPRYYCCTRGSLKLNPKTHQFKVEKLRKSSCQIHAHIQA